MEDTNHPLQEIIARTREIGFENPKARQRLEDAIASAQQDYIKVVIPDTEEFMMDSGTWTLAKNCPIEHHYCANQPEGCEGGSCAFYNGHKEKCVYPRTCINNTDSSVTLNMYDGLRGKISTYWGDQSNETAQAQIEQKCKELGLHSSEWAYAEFDDDGKIVRLAELGTSEQAEEWERERKKSKRIFTPQQQEEKMSAQQELDRLMAKYDNKAREDIQRIIELYRTLC
jgi:hypothetical protein